MLRAACRNAGSVKKQQLRVFNGTNAEHGAASRVGLVAHRRNLLANKGVQQRALSDIRLSTQSNGQNATAGISLVIR